MQLLSAVFLGVACGLVVFMGTRSFHRPEDVVRAMKVCIARGASSRAFMCVYVCVIVGL